MFTSFDRKRRTVTVQFPLETLRVPVAGTSLRRLRGMFFTDYEALLIMPCNSVHSIGFMKPLDVAYLDKAGNVLAVKPLKPWRMHLPVKHGYAVIETLPGLLDKWGVVEGQPFGTLREGT